MKRLYTPMPLSLEQKKELEWKLFYENMLRSKLLAQILILFQLFLIVLHIASSTPVLTIHLAVYGLLLILGLTLLVLIKRFKNGPLYEAAHVLRFKRGLYTILFTFLLCGAVLALADYEEYGNLMPFVIHAICIALLYHTSSLLFLSLFTIPFAVLLVGISFSQSSNSIRIDSYISLGSFMFFCWLAAKMLYTRNTRNFRVRMLLEQTNEQLELAVEELKRLSVIDELTNIPNRRAFEEFVQLATIYEAQQQLSILLIDIDSFKRFNDYYGHLEGDYVIRQVAQQIKACTNAYTGITARYGGEEFISAIFYASDDEMQQLGEQIRTRVEAMQIPHVQSTNSNVVTISIGLVTADIETLDDIKQLIKYADEMLYEAKQHGRNRLEIYLGQCEIETQSLLN